MLEVKNLTKIYKTKGDNVTKALDDVSLKFPDKGMVFLLGKSGSGKSTLLNLIGGLDNSTSGEIIVKGRSSDTFSGSDFDSYRNTFIGFIFQEYNILNEFTVEDNIALALELQGKSKDKERIKELLEQVDLANFAKRKPNTLSGGQKQRIAIARALIKDPEIIMADEPTGALDSNTGKQVLETLKKLSETKLVIIVSHDRDFAEIYANRIIELKDGKIISDVTKSAVAATQVGNVSFIDDNTLSIKDGSSLNKEDLEVINNYLIKNNQEILITGSSRDITIFKQNTGITGDSRETFSDTKEESIEALEYDGKDTKFIKSKLPIKHASKMGASSLKLKPFRLVFTILLSSIAFILLGVVSTLMFYNYNNVAATSISESSIDYLSVSRGYKYKQSWNGEESSYKSTGNTLFTQEEVNDLSNKYGNVIPVYNFSRPSKIGAYVSNGMTIQNLIIPNNKGAFYFNTSAGFAPGFEKTGFNILAGEAPKNSNEVLISSYLFDCMKNGTFKSTTANENIMVNNYNDVLNKELYLSALDKELVISGIYDVNNLIPNKFKALLEETSSYNNDQWQWQQEVSNGIYSVLFVTDSFYSDNLEFASSNGDSKEYISEVHIDDTYYNIYSLLNLKYTKAFDLNGNSITSVSDNQVILDSRVFSSLIEAKITNLIDEKRNQGDYEFLNDFFEGGYDINTEVYTYSIENKLYQWVGNGEKDIFEFDEYGNVISSVPVSLTIDERVAALKEVLAYLEANNVELDLNIRLSQDANANYESFELCGVAFSNNGDGMILSENKAKNYLAKDSSNVKYETNYTINEDAIYSAVLVKNSHDFASVKDMFGAFNSVADDDSCYIINSYLMNSLEMVNSLIETLTQVFLWVGVVLAVFATLLLFNFISMSITNKKKEIGILRAVGARGTDVFKIFFSESFIIVAICSIIAIIGSIVTCSIINANIAKALSGVRIFVFGPGSIVIILGLALLVSLLSTFLPVFNFAKKKPVDSIRAL